MISLTSIRKLCWEEVIFNNHLSSLERLSKWLYCTFHLGSIDVHSQRRQFVEHAQLAPHFPAINDYRNQEGRMRNQWKLHSPPYGLEHPWLSISGLTEHFPVSSLWMQTLFCVVYANYSFLLLVFSCLFGQCFAGPWRRASNSHLSHPSTAKSGFRSR